MAQQFSTGDWTAINAKLTGNETGYGLPERRQGSVVLASWNVRKCGALLDSAGNPGNSDGAFDLIAKFCGQCDLISVQEVLQSLESIHRVRGQLNGGADGPYKLLSSDVTGALPGDKGLTERMVFLYDTRRVELGEIVSDVSLDRNAIVGNVNAALRKVHAELVAESPNDLGLRLQGWLEQALPFNKDKLESFLQFIRAPYLATFHIAGTGGAAYELACVDAHLQFGKPKEREREFFALLDWMGRTASRPDVVLDAPVLLLMGDCNLDFGSSNDKRREAIETVITELNKGKTANDARVNFPFLDSHPGQTASFRTNARSTETFDQIAWFSRDDRFPRGRHNNQAGQNGPDDFDFGMFDFVRLIVDSGKAKKPDGSVDYARFEFDLSDHMPIWLRMPVPSPTQRRYPVT